VLALLAALSGAILLLLARLLAGLIALLLLAGLLAGLIALLLLARTLLGVLILALIHFLHSSNVVSLRWLEEDCLRATPAN
jgi:hypothetical protein